MLYFDKTQTFMAVSYTVYSKVMNMGIVVEMNNYTSEQWFTNEFRSRYKLAQGRRDYLGLLKWSINYYVVPDNPKEHQIFAVLSVIYDVCPESFFDYVKDFDAVERDFMITVKMLFEEGDIDKDNLLKWKREVLGLSVLSPVEKNIEIIQDLPTLSALDPKN